MSILLTPAAAERVKTFIASRGKGLGLRLGVRKTGWPSPASKSRPPRPRPPTAVTCSRAAWPR